MYLSIEEIDRYIKEDVPYIDLTSWSLGIGEQACEITYFTRDKAVVCGTEEVNQIFERLNIKSKPFLSSGASVNPGDELISGIGQGCDVNMAWKVGQNILEHSSGIATKTQYIVRIVKENNPEVAVFTTRKIFPGTKPLAVKAIMAGGATPHRLGLSETILIFKQHIDLIGGFDALFNKIQMLKIECSGKNIIVESNEYDEAKQLCKAGVDGIQFDKVSADILKETVKQLKKEFPKILIFATGGITESNAADYAKTNVDGIVTTNLYYAKPVDIGVKINQG